MRGVTIQNEESRVSTLGCWIENLSQPTDTKVSIRPTSLGNAKAGLISLILVMIAY